MDLFEEYLNKKETSKWVKRALTDKSYKAIYQVQHKCVMPEEYCNFELATYGDAILKWD